MHFPFCSPVWFTLFLSARSLFLSTMASENPAETPVQGDAAPQTLPDRTQTPTDNQGESKNAAKKAAKAAKLAADKANKANKANKGDNAAPKSDKQAPKKAPKKKIEGAALIGIDVSKVRFLPLSCISFSCSLTGRRFPELVSAGSYKGRHA